MRWIPSLIAVFVAAPLLAPLPPLAREARAQSALRTIELAPGLVMWMGRGGNIGVVHGPEGSLLVDDQFAEVSPELRAGVERLGGAPIRFVVNTHWHGDHTGSNEALAKQGAVVVAHEKVRERMSSEQWSALSRTATPPSPAGAWPVVTFDRGLRFHLNGHTVEVLHVDPAHTDGDSIVRFVEADVLHLGDVYFNGLYPYIDVASGGSIDGMIAGASRALALCEEETRIIPGHGPLSGPDELRGHYS